MKRYCGIVGVMAITNLVALLIVIGVLSEKFNQNVTGYLENAAHANTVEMAIPPMQTALNYLKEHGYTEGYTSVFYCTQNENVGFWFQNLNSSLEELETIQKEKNLTPLEQSNVLMKLHQTLYDETKQAIRQPNGIPLFPLNKQFAFTGLILLIIGILGMGISLHDLNKRNLW